MEVRFKLTKYRAAIAALFVLAGVGLGNLLSPLVGSALATVGTVSNISDHSASAYFAKVSSDGKLAVGDGAGPLSVDGTVASRPSAPASPWHANVEIDTNPGLLAGPSATPINLTSLSISTSDPASTGVSIYAYSVASSATSCSTTTFEEQPWSVITIGDGVNSFTFPTPLQYKPPANKKACVYAVATSNSAVVANAVGFYGG
jgi:hypothetical protein